MKTRFVPLLALAMLACALTMVTGDAYAAFGPVAAGAPSLAPLAIIGAGSAARIFTAWGPKPVLDKPGEGGIEGFTKAFEDFQKETLAKIAAVAGDSAAVKEQLATIEQSMMKRLKGGGADPAPESLGDQFVKDESGIRALAESFDRRKAASHSIRVKTSLTSLTTDAAGSVGPGPRTQITAIDPLRRHRLRIRDLMNVIPVTTGAVEYPKQIGRNNNAGMVAEGGSKPESDIQMTMETAQTRVIAHWMKASRQVLDDIPQLRGLIDSELLDGLKDKEEQQILYGDGTGQNLPGVVAEATAFVSPVTMIIEQHIDYIGMALLQAALAKYPANGIVLHPSDWMAIRLLKDSNGNYIMGPPGGVVTPALFGVPVVESNSMTPRKFLVGDFLSAAMIFDRWEARVEVGFVNDDFIKNMVTLLGEERLALATKRPEALIYGDFDDPT